MRKCIIFGCGNIGKQAYNKLKTFYEIVAWSDNNQNLHGKKISSIPVIKPLEIPSFAHKGELDVFVAMLQTGEVVSQLRRLGEFNIYIWKGGFFFSADGLSLLEFPAMEYHKRGILGNIRWRLL